MNAKVGIICVTKYLQIEKAFMVVAKDLLYKSKDIHIEQHVAGNILILRSFFFFDKIINTLCCTKARKKYMSSNMLPATF